MADIRKMADAIRFLAIDSILNAGEGHQGVPLGMAEIAATLYARHLKADPKNPLWHDRDRVVLSNGHGSMLLYTLLHLSGYEAVSLDQLKTFRRLGSICAGHPEIEQHAGIEMTTGLLGQGICSAVGMAIAEARLAAQFGADLVDHRTWAFVGDGCLQEGMGQEAISLAGHLQLGKLTFLWDDNHITDDGETDLSISEDIPARFRAANWHVQEIDGHDIEAIDLAIRLAKADPRPSMLACRTTIARGLPRLQGLRGGHSAPLIPQDRVEAAEARGWTNPAFEVPAEIYNDFTQSLTRGAQARQDWQGRLSSSPNRVEYDRWMSGDIPTKAQEVLDNYRADALAAKAAAPTIQSSGEVCDALRDALPNLMILCADLEAPTNHKRGREAFTMQNRGGSYVHCGVREHLMGAMANGIAAHGGLRPVNVTYLAFADYERAAMRMAAVMNLPVIYVFSHDSIGVGSNGPTHQPVEVLASFRVMPNMNVLRPADAAETLDSWRLALAHRSGPSMFALSKQPALPVAGEQDGVAKGGYVVTEPSAPRDLTLMATGTEVAIATEAAETLANEGLNAAVVSIPCWEIFDQQPEIYQAQVLGAAPRLAIEAALSFGWQRFLREGDSFLGMTGYGASDKAEALYAHFGLTAENLAAKGAELVRAQRPLISA
ncbi:transketolase [Thalassovita sp.]|uniref:transketolase n=1 Tax=Thalassovita sp. TaxID=1979401 RepID=UPI0029DE7956|nr:transketolase [Thalassovita sp.]